MRNYYIFCCFNYNLKEFFTEYLNIYKPNKLKKIKQYERGTKLVEKKPSNRINFIYYNFSNKTKNIV